MPKKGVKRKHRQNKIPKENYVDVAAKSLLFHRAGWAGAKRVALTLG